MITFEGGCSPLRQSDIRSRPAIMTGKEQHMSRVTWLSVLLILGIACCCAGDASDNGMKLWPEIEPYESGYLTVSDIHEIYYEVCGNPDGRPVFR